MQLSSQHPGAAAGQTRAPLSSRRDFARRDLAVVLAKGGLRVFPLEINGKTPAIDDWPTLASNDPERVRRFWSDPVSGEAEDWNIGVATGHGLMVIDVDNKNGKEGSASLAALEHEHGPLPPTAAWSTASGGEHRLFRVPVDAWVGNSAGKIGDGLDVRGERGYVVAVGSTIDGRSYEFRQPVSQLADAPQWLLDLVKGERPRSDRGSLSGHALDDDTDIARAIEYLETRAPAAVEGDAGDHTAYTVACRVLDYGLTPQTALEVMLDHWNDRCAPPWAPEELETKIANAATYRQNPVGSHSVAVEFDAIDLPEQADAGIPITESAAFEGVEPVDPWGVPQLPPDLRPGILPPVLEAWAQDEAERKGVALGAVATPALAMLAGSASARLVVQVKQHDTGHTDRPILWAALVGGPGSGKSPALNAVMRPLLAIDSRRKAEFTREKEAYDRAESVRNRRKGAENGEELPPPRRPRDKSKVIMDATVESVVMHEAETQNGCVLFSDELSGFAGGMDAYRANKGSVSRDAAFWLSAKQGAPYDVKRVSREHVRTEVHAVSIIGGIQPDVVQKFGAEWSGNGLIQRFLLVCMGRSRVPQDRPPNQGAAAALSAAVRQIVDLTPDEVTPVFRFSPEADASRRSIVEFARATAELPETPVPLQGWLDKMEGEWARIALVLHLVQWATNAEVMIDDWPPEVISAETAQRAERFLVEYQWEHQRHFHTAVLGAGVAREPAQSLAGHILAHERREITTRLVQQTFRRWHEDQRVAALDTLEKMGWLRATGAFRHGRPTRWAVNPLVHERFADHAVREAANRAEARAAIQRDAAARRNARLAAE